MSRLLLASLSVLISVATSSFEYPKRSENYPSSLKPIISGISALQRSRDRRTTHWESRANSNFDDDRTENDRDEGRRRISYPPLGYSRRTEQSVKLSDAIDVTASNVGDDMRLDQDCVARKPIVLVTFGGAKRTLDDVMNLQKTQAYAEIFGPVRCRRRLGGWKVQEPIYVEEPGWIVIDLDGQTNQRHGLNDQDPFYVARGRRSVVSSSSELREKLNTNDIASTKNTSINKINTKKNRQSSIAEEKKKSENVARIKRQSFNGDATRSLVEDEETSLPGLLVRKSNANGYVQLRDKHSDILDILNEPFFISRGKKNSLKMGIFEWNNRYAKALENFESGKGSYPPDGGYFSRDSRSDMGNDCESRTGECIVGSLMAKDSGAVGGDAPYRDRRGVMEDLLKETDPFYVARGKRSTTNALLQSQSTPKALQSVSTPNALNSRSASTENTVSVTEAINDNSSVSVEH